MRSLIERLHREHTLAPDEFRILLSQCNDKDLSYINALAREVSHASFGNRIFIRGLIEVGNRCKNDCYYCGIRRSNHLIERYHLDEETILGVLRTWLWNWDSGTFVLQGGEMNDDKMIYVLYPLFEKSFQT